ncbi:MAG: hypothetical protein ACOC44_15470 [Promethearchaeia archaeon]
MRNFILNKVFGNSVRVKVIEVLLDSLISEEKDWLNLSDIAREADISVSSSKRIVDQLIEEEFADLNRIETHAKNPKKEVRLNMDNKIAEELIFFYRKIKGFI